MAFLDQFSKKVSQVGQGAAQSAKNFAAVTKLNSMISEEEKKVNNLFYQIGKTYFETNSQNPAENLAGYVSAVTEALQTIETYKEQIKETKGITNCPNCGAEVSYSSSFCNSCGAKIPQQPQTRPQNDNTVRCSNCGNYVPKGYKFCTACGNVMNVPAEDSVVTAESDAPAEESAAAVCPSCGKEVNSDMAFCTGCGQKL